MGEGKWKPTLSQSVIAVPLGALRWSKNKESCTAESFRRPEKSVRLEALFFFDCVHATAF